MNESTPFVLLGSLLLLLARHNANVSAFTTSSAQVLSRQTPTSTRTSLGYRSSVVTIDVSETTQRQVGSLQDWATACGVQTAEGVRVTQTSPSINNPDGQDYHLETTQAIAADTPVLCVPKFMTLSSADVPEALGGNLEATENALESADRLPLFRLLVQILSQVEAGDASSFLPWFEALPRRFNNGVAMTDACFECLPPYASYLSSQERSTFEIFLKALREGYLELSNDTLQDISLLTWAYNVALTRHQVNWNQEGELDKIIAPMADMLNHASFPNCDIQYDEEGNVYVMATEDIPANTQLTISYGDPTDPTPLFAKYGFLENDCPTIFCKAIHLQEEMQALGYAFADLLMDTRDGSLVPAVWDLFLYSLMLQNEEGGELSQPFLEACTSGDEETKNSYHMQYFTYTAQSLQEFIDGLLEEVDQLTSQARTYDQTTHPRVPMIVAHNTLVRNTFLKAKTNLENMLLEAEEGGEEMAYEEGQVGEMDYE